MCLARLEKELSSTPPAPWSAIRPAPPASDVALLATDAHPYGLGYVLYDGDGRVVAWEHCAIPETLQVVAETQAVTWAIKRVQARLDGARRNFLIAVDADTARAAFNKGYARSEAMQALMREAFALTDWLTLVRVPGLENAADAPSRNTPLVEKFVRETFGVLRHYRATL